MDNEDNQDTTQDEDERDQVMGYNFRERKPMDYKQVTTKGLLVNTSSLLEDFSGNDSPR